jgi:cytochrome c peroxidase
MKKLIIGSTILFIVFLTSLTVFNYNCVSLPSTLYHYMTLSEMPSDIQNTTFPLADTVRNMDNMPYSVGLNGLPNNTTDAGATLGRVLFYDVDLSKNRTISCASCHKQEFGFSDSAKYSKGFLGGLTDRNSMGLIHTRFDKAIVMFWDGRAKSVEDQVTQPIRDPVEMGMSAANTNNKQWDTITARIRSKSFYPGLFRAAFGSTTIDSQRIALALAQFVRSMNAYTSKWRRTIDACNCNPAVAPLTPYGFTAQQQLGRDLFMDVTRGNCQACHTRNIFVPQGAQNNGADGSLGPGSKFVWRAWSTRDDYRGKDSGFAGVKSAGRYSGVLGRDSNKIKTNIGRMKVPSLVNIGITAPYFHDGRYKTLDEVINFYSDSIRNNDYNTLSLFFRRIDPHVPGAPNNVTNQLAIDTSPVRVIAYTPTEKAALKAFLLTMTDTGFVRDVRFSNPFCVVSTGRTVSRTKELSPVLSLEAYPNPSSKGSSVIVEVITGQDFTGSLKIYNDKSKVVLSINTKFIIGINKFTVNTSSLTPGMYTIIAQKQNTSVFFKELIIK